MTIIIENRPMTYRQLCYAGPNHTSDSFDRATVAAGPIHCWTAEDGTIVLVF